MNFKGDIIITDPCYIIDERNRSVRDDWDHCEYGENMEALGINNYINSSTGYGDWSCEVKDNSGDIIGNFCADSGQVAIFLIEEVLNYNPLFDYHLNRPHTTTLIQGFNGTVDVCFDSDGIAYVIGEGTKDGLPFSFRSNMG